MSIKKVSFEFDPFEMSGYEKPKSVKERAKFLEEVSEYVRNEILDYVAESTSPVSGGKFKSTLSPAYAKRKKREVGNTNANLELSGDLLNALEVVVKPGGKLEVRVEGSEAPKADGHCNHSGESMLPERIFIPKEGQTFKRGILTGIKGIAREFLEED